MLLLFILPTACTETETDTPSVLKVFPLITEQDTEPPRVIDTFPPNGTQDVDPALTEISVTFNEEMENGSWSWAYMDASRIPEMPFSIPGPTHSRSF